MIVSDITTESSAMATLNSQREKTLKLLSQVVPKEFAMRLQDGESRISFSAGIGTVMTVILTDYVQLVDSAHGADEFIITFRMRVDKLLKEHPNITMIWSIEGKFLFIAGLFNDEQNGRTEALDTFKFGVAFHGMAAEVFEEFGQPANVQYGVCTGGPIYCKLLMESPPILMVSEDTYHISRKIVKMARPGELIIERTTYECIYGVNIDATMAGDFEYNGRHTSLYRIPMHSISDLNGN